ncbi:MAG: UDP-N-acetylglucosamine--N-acetylmuramyl-(pentapeptide) pyrophosphoryl-undecaprenol N-acetylglucosamine transferase [Candidatus Shapirobacteria bacterium]|nr:UDP-N-acetylglucosamine--N-acetylmuramyl-(pentapeptide) pyrophosphoryl-undecaprenol N-acetylglucosamine transferase [Candidatus Shapirobacteria bacterium]
MEKRKIVIRGGHLTPALAVIEELQKRGNWEIFYIGRKYSAEGDKTPSLESMVAQEKGICFIPINFGRLQHKFTRYTIQAFLRIPWGFILSFYHLARVKPDIILSFGSYVGVPVVISGWLLGIPIVIHEQTTVVGLGNKINSFFAKKICVSWPENLTSFPKGKTILTGNPLRSDIFKTDTKILSTLKFSKGKPLILVTGGNQGSHRINVAIEGALEKLLTKYNLFHQTGHLAGFGDFERLEDKKNKLSSNLKASYHLKKYVTGEEWGTLLCRADLVISRAGINTIAELIALGKPQLLIPIPWLPGDEQTKNAQMVKKIGLAEVLSQDDLNPQSLFKKIGLMMSKIDVYRQNKNKAEKLIIKNATQKIVDELEKTT